MEEDAARRTKQEKENAALEKVVEDMKVDVPECMIDKRLENIIRENDGRMAQQGISFEQYLTYMGSTLDQFKEQMKPMAERQVKGTLALEKIAKLENIEISDEDLDKNLADMAAAYKMELDKLKEILRPEDMENVKEDMKLSKAAELIVDNASWTKAKASAKKTAEGGEKKTAAKKTATKTTAAKSSAKSAGTKTAAKKTTAKKTTKAKEEKTTEE